LRSGQAHASETTTASGCSDSRYTETVWPRLVDLQKAVIQVDAGHGDIALLDAAAPGLVSAASSTLATAGTNRPCKPGLVRADRKLLAATRTLSHAGTELTQLTAAAKKGKDYSDLQNLFLGSYYAGTDGFGAALTALRSAGAPTLVKATDGKAIFLEAGAPHAIPLQPPEPRVLSVQTSMP
jgi:hypothetical protein